MVLHPPRRHDQVRREPAQEVRGHLPAQLLVRRPARRSGTRCRDVFRFWIGHGVRIFRVDNPHTKPFAFWEWVIARGPAGVSRRDLPGRGVHPAQADAGAGQARVHPVLHLFHLAQRARPSWPSTRPSWPTPDDGGVFPGQLLGQHAGHPPRVPAGGRAAGLPDPPGARRHAVAALRHLQRLRAVRAHPACAPGARSISTPRSTSSGCATGRRRERLDEDDRPAQPGPPGGAGAPADGQRQLPPGRPCGRPVLRQGSLAARPALRRRR